MQLGMSPHTATLTQAEYDQPSRTHVLHCAAMTTQWHIIELLDGGWAVRRNGVLQLRSVLVERAWAYVAERVADDDQVQTQYHNGRSGPVMAGAEMRELAR